MVEDKNVRVVTLGQEFNIDLEAIPGGGYSWGVDHIPDAIELISQSVTSVSKEIGGNSMQRFIFSARQNGTYSLNFELKRSWEKQAVKTASFTIRVS